MKDSSATSKEPVGMSDGKKKNVRVESGAQWSTEPLSRTIGVNRGSSGTDDSFVCRCFKCDKVL